jgi:hypothetical protein
VPTDTSVFLSTAGSAVGMSFLIEALKGSNWFPWLTMETKNLNRIVGIITAGLITVGIHFTWTESTGDTAGILSIAIPTIPTFAHGVWTWFTTWAFQQYAYRVAVKS